VLTLANAAKPPVVDDTAYLLFARHLAADPLHPYGFELFWYARAQPAMEVLLPPVLPYWLAAGIALFGERLLLLKLWLFPAAWLFCRAAGELAGRFAPTWQRPATALLALGPAALPLFNVMLDLPAAALGLTAVAALARDRVILAGLAAGLAAQTKYTAMVVPLVFCLHGLTHRRFTPAALASLVAAAVFVGWEGFVWWRCGESHFLHHLARQSADGPGEKWRLVQDLARPLVAQLGGVAVGWGLLAWWCGGVRGNWLAGLAVLAAGGLTAVAVVPEADAVLLRNGRTGSPRLDLPGLVYLTLGYATLAGLARCAWVATGPGGRFLALWLLAELVGYFALTPFPATRRVLPVVLPAGLLVAHTGRRVGRPPGWVVGFGLATGVALFALDAWDARVEPAMVDRVAGRIAGGGRVWTQGHWGWQYAADRRGWTLVEPGVSRTEAGDWLVLPVEPDNLGFYRPYHGGAKVDPSGAPLELVAEFVADDWLAAQTVPNLYGGAYPVVGRSHPRLRVRLYRLTADYRW
jgi:hypothetical protein